MLLEIAYFDPARIGATGRKLGLTSDARTPVRARGRSGVPRSRAGAADRADPRDLRRRGVGSRPRRHAADGDRARSPTIRRSPRGSAASTFPRPSSARSSSGSASRCRRRLDRCHRAELAARHRRRAPTSSRKSSASTGSTRSPASPLPRAEGVARPTATPEQTARAPPAPRRRCARARRSGHLVVPARARGRSLRRRQRRAVGAGQPDQRGHEGHAPLAAAGPAGGGAAQPRPRRRRRAAVRDRPPLSARRRRASDERASLAVVLAGEKDAARLGDAARRAPFDAFDAKAEALALLAEAGAPVDKPPGHGRGRAAVPSRPVGDAAARAEDRARAVRRAASRDAARRSTSMRRPWRSSCSSTRSRRGRAARLRPPALRAAGAAGGDARLRLPGPAGASGGRPASARSKAPTRPTSSPRGCSTSSAAPACPRAEVARDRGHAPAGREELRRGGPEGDRRPDRRRGREAGGGAARLSRAPTRRCPTAAPSPSSRTPTRARPR